MHHFNQVSRAAMLLLVLAATSQAAFVTVRVQILNDTATIA